MPAYTDARIRVLCAKALAASTQPDVEKALSELRAAIHAHASLAKVRLETRVAAVQLIASLSRSKENKAA